MDNKYNKISDILEGNHIQQMLILKQLYEMVCDHTDNGTDLNVDLCISMLEQSKEMDRKTGQIVNVLLAESEDD